MRKEVYLCDECGKEIKEDVFSIHVYQEVNGAFAKDEEYDLHFHGAGCAFQWLGKLSTLKLVSVTLSQEEV